MKKIIVSLNLIGLNRLLKQALKVLIFIKELTESVGYAFTYDNVMEKRLVQFFDTKKDDVLVNLTQKPLKSLLMIFNYLTEEGYIRKTTTNGYVITNTGLNRIYELESFNFLVVKTITLIGTMGGIAYFPKLLKDIFEWALSLFRS